MCYFEDGILRVPFLGESMMRRLLSLLLTIPLLLAPACLLSQQTDPIRLTDEEKEILTLTNAARKEQQLPPLVINATLMKSARQHSANMAKQNKMSHKLDDKSPFDRLEDIGYEYAVAGENIASGDASISIKEIFQGWMDSKGHRENILGKDYVEIGLGIAASGEQKYYTQVFGKPLK
jgi:uncharacterized protein YkwD